MSSNRRAILFLSAGAALFAAGARAAERYVAVFVDGRRVGYGKATRTVTPQKVTHTQETAADIDQGGRTDKLRKLLIHVETPDGRPIAFSLAQSLNNRNTEVRGRVDADGNMTVVTSSPQGARRLTRPWPKGALLSQGLRVLHRKKGLRPDSLYKAHVFEVPSLSAVEMTFEIGPKRQIDLLGRVVSLTEVRDTAQLTPKITVRSTWYVDDDQNILQSTTALRSGQTLSMVACHRAFALSGCEQGEFLARALVDSPAQIQQLPRFKAIRYVLAPKPGKAIGVVAMDNQSLRPGSGGRWTVQVHRAPAPPRTALPYHGGDKTALAALRATEYLRCDDSRIIALARRAAGHTTDAAVAARRIRDFVAAYITKKPLAVGYASATEVAASRQGDCTEYAVLTAALCRAVGVPAQVVFGLVYSPEFGGRKHAFGPHAWCRVFLGGKWYHLDAAIEHGYEVGHIALAAGDGHPDGFFNTIAAMATFQITAATLPN